MEEPVETAELLAFAQTVEAKSVSRAAAELGVPRATISRRLARLEERLRTRLIRRTTRSLALTDSGELLYRHARLVLDAVNQAEASVRRDDAKIAGDLRVSVPPMVTPSFQTFLCDFAERYPDVRLQVQFASRLVDLRRDGYDVAIRASGDLEPGLIARKLHADRAIAVASPAYLKTHGTPVTRRDLAKHRCLTGFARGELPQTQWPFGRGGLQHVESALCSNELLLLTEAARRGLGIAFLPQTLVGPLIEDGELEQVLAGTLEREIQIAVVYLERELVPPQVRAFVDAVIAWAPAGLDPMPRCREPVRRAKK